MRAPNLNIVRSDINSIDTAATNMLEFLQEIEMEQELSEKQQNLLLTLQQLNDIITEVQEEQKWI